MPPKKRPVEPEWTRGDRVRRALISANAALAKLRVELAALPADAERAEINVGMLDAFRGNISLLEQHADKIAPQLIPVLPTDCWRIIMEFALDRRSAATFGTDAQINEPYVWLRAQSAERTQTLHTLRLVSRNWCGAATQLVRTIVANHIKLPDCSAATRVFTKARFMTAPCAAPHEHPLVRITEYGADITGRIHYRSRVNYSRNTEIALQKSDVFHWTDSCPAQLMFLKPQAPRVKLFLLDYKPFIVVMSKYFRSLEPADRRKFRVVVRCKRIHEVNGVYKEAWQMHQLAVYIATDTTTPVPKPPNVTIVPQTLQNNNHIFVPK
jgi:hypothetical protein